VASRTASRRHCRRPDLGTSFLEYYLDDINPRIRRQIERHLATCRPCREEFGVFVAAWRGLRRRKGTT
jgi:hypothetical protein